MGIFDYVEFSATCPCCGSLIKEFQAKHEDASMSTIKPWEVPQFHSSCDSCHSFIEYKIKPEVDKTNIISLMQSGQSLIKAIEDLLNERGDKTVIKQEIEKSVFNVAIGKDSWLDYYNIHVTPPRR